MDINQIREKKVAVEKEIYDLIVKFSEETGLIVEDINHETLDISVCGESGRRQYTSVTLDVRLG